MIDLLQLAQDTTQAAQAGGVDWQGIALVIGALGTFVATVLGAMGYSNKAKQVVDATARAQAVVQGIEEAQNGDSSDLLAAIKEATGVELTPEQVSAARQVYSSHVKKVIKKTAMAMNVPDPDFVEKGTGKLSKEKLREKLEQDGQGQA